MKLILGIALCATIGAPLLMTTSARADTRRSDLNIEADLLEAAAMGNSQRVATLLKQGAKTETRDAQTTWTPLMMAARGGHVATVRVLLQRGARVNARSVGSAKTYMALATLSARQAASVATTVEANGETAPDTTAFFLSANNGVTPLMLAAAGGWNLAAQELLKRGAEVNARSTSGESALEAACFKGYLPLVKTLVEAGAQINAKNGRGESALGVAVLNGHAPVVNYLLARKADPNAPLNNYAMLTVARYYGFTNIARDLQRHGAKTSLTSTKNAATKSLATKNAATKSLNAKTQSATPPKDRVGAPAASGSGIIVLN